MVRKEMEKVKTDMKKKKGVTFIVDDMPDPLKFVDQKNTAVDLRNSVKNWERKLEIAEVAAKKARTILRQVGEHVEEIIRPEFLSATGGHHAAVSEDEAEQYEN